MNDIDGAIKNRMVDEYIKQYKTRCKELPTDIQVCKFKDGIMENAYYYYKRGFNIEDAVRKVMNDVDN